MELIFAKSCWEYWPGTWLTKSPALQVSIRSFPGRSINLGMFGGS